MLAIPIGRLHEEAEISRLRPGHAPALAPGLAALVEASETSITQTARSPNRKVPWFGGR
jgi:hypothetical protein